MNQSEDGARISEEEAANCRPSFLPTLQSSFSAPRRKFEDSQEMGLVGTLVERLLQGFEYPGLRS